MTRTIKNLFLFIFFLPGILFGKIRIICTAALTDAHYEFRKNQYIRAMETLKSYGYKEFYIIESCRKHGPSFLEEYSKNVFYAQTNDLTLRNNGINEAKTLLEGCKYFDFDPDDIIIKLTGRHSLISDFLLKTVESHPDVDAFIKVNENENVYTVGFALRYKYLKEMYEHMDYASAEHFMTPIEYKVGDYFRSKKMSMPPLKVFHLNKLDIYAVLHGSSTHPTAVGVGTY